MDANTVQPSTLTEAIRYFTDPVNCREYLVSRRWPNGVTCPVCGSKTVYFDTSPERLGVQDPAPEAEVHAQDRDDFRGLRRSAWTSGFRRSG